VRQLGRSPGQQRDERWLLAGTGQEQRGREPGVPGGQSCGLGLQEQTPQVTNVGVRNLLSYLKQKAATMIPD